jgi:hypothetical protein
VSGSSRLNVDLTCLDCFSQSQLRIPGSPRTHLASDNPNCYGVFAIVFLSPCHDLHPSIGKIVKQVVEDWSGSAMEATITLGREKLSGAPSLTADC